MKHAITLTLIAMITMTCAKAQEPAKSTNNEKKTKKELRKEAYNKLYHPSKDSSKEWTFYKPFYKSSLNRKELGYQTNDKMKTFNDGKQIKYDKHERSN